MGRGSHHPPAVEQRRKSMLPCRGQVPPRICRGVGDPAPAQCGKPNASMNESKSPGSRWLWLAQNPHLRAGAGCGRSTNAQLFDRVAHVVHFCIGGSKLSSPKPASHVCSAYSSRAADVRERPSCAGRALSSGEAGMGDHGGGRLTARRGRYGPNVGVDGFTQ